MENYKETIFKSLKQIISTHFIKIQLIFILLIIILLYLSTLSEIKPNPQFLDGEFTIKEYEQEIHKFEFKFGKVGVITLRQMTADFSIVNLRYHRLYVRELSIVDKSTPLPPPAIEPLIAA